MKVTISHLARLQQLPHVGTPPILDEYQLVTEKVEVNGRVMLQSVNRSVNPKDRFKGLKASDFALESVLAAGAIDTLRPVSLVTPSAVNDDFLASLESYADKLLRPSDS